LKTVEIRGGPCDLTAVAVDDWECYLQYVDPDQSLISYRTDLELSPIDTLPPVLNLKIERDLTNRYFAQWPIREDIRYCPRCACPIATAHIYNMENVGVACRKEHFWHFKLDALWKANPPERWSEPMRKEYERFNSCHR